jgi:hypothetical protein
MIFMSNKFKIVKIIANAERQSGCYGYNVGDIGIVTKEDSQGFTVFVPNKKSTSGFAPCVWFYLDEVHILTQDEILEMHVNANEISNSWLVEIL